MIRFAATLALPLLLGPWIVACAHPADAPPAPAGLVGTGWQLVRILSMDDIVAVPDDGSHYTLWFAKDGGLAVRADCNRGHGRWTSVGPSQLEIGPLALTRAMCPPESLDSRFVRDLGFVRSYVLQDGHLFLATMADGGLYEFEPLAP